jgi:hypothetical protein
MRPNFLMIIAVATTLCVAGASSSEELRQKLAPDDPATEPARTEGRGVPSVTVLESQQAQGILGKEVRSSANENMGRIVDVIVDRTGRVRAAVIDFGGFLGVGSRKIAVDWSALRFDRDSDKRDVVRLGLTRDQVKAAPEYRDSQAVVVLGASGGLQSLPADW